MSKQRIRPLAICVFRHDGKILATESVDSVKGQTFYRPLGGRIEFGETAVETLHRELMEEIQAEIGGLRYLGMLENIFTYEGERGHEIVMVFDGRLVDESLYGRPFIERTDTASGESLRAVWKRLSDFGPGGSPLYPDGILELMEMQPPA
jgi:8-oxo-dGTP pyrophosphatase MutT (NUDIX family)